jgi:hypothetical protein
MPRCKSPLLPLPSLLPRANNESSLREHDGITLNFVTHEQKSCDKDKGDSDLPKVSVKCISLQSNEVGGRKDLRVTMLDSCKVCKVHSEVTLGS